MDFLVKFASAFMSVFQAGGANFVSWVTGIIPTILMLLVMMNAIIALIGDERIEVIAKMALSMGKFMPEFYKPSYYASASYHCHTNSGIFPHINPSEIMIYLGIAQGLTALGLDSTPLALRYMLVGFIANFISGWATDFTTAFVQKQQGIKLSKELKAKA